MNVEWDKDLIGNFRAAKLPNGIWVIQYYCCERKFRVWSCEQKWFREWQPLPDGLTYEEALQYMETIWRMEG